MNFLDKSPIRSTDITLSIVSHGQGALIESLLIDINKDKNIYQNVILTINIPECEDFIKEDYAFPLTIIRNTHPKGFGENHNSAFNISNSKYFAVVNPDIRLHGFNLENLLAPLEISDVSACGPIVLSTKGTTEDSARKFPTLASLVRRKLFNSSGPEYSITENVTYVDWLAGMFLVFKSESFRAIGGFDKRYFMYMEDVDICRRLKLAGQNVCLVSSCSVTHDARRASRSNFKHMRWHFSSALIYFTSNLWRRKWNN